MMKMLQGERERVKMRREKQETGKSVDWLREMGKGVNGPVTSRGRETP